jgi:hypothetical protein
LPIVLCGIYCLFIGRHFFFALSFSIAFYFHLKTPGAVLLALLPLILSELRLQPRIIFQLMVPLLVLVPKAVLTMRTFYGGEVLSTPDKMELDKLTLVREGIEGAIYFDAQGLTNLSVYTLLAMVGIVMGRFIDDRELRKKIYLAHAGVFLAVGVGLLVRFLDSHWTPLGALVVLGYARATILGLLVILTTFALLGYQKLADFLQSGSVWKLYLLLTALLVFSLNSFYFTQLADVLKDTTNFRSAFKLVFALVGSAVVMATLGLCGFRLSASQVVHLLLVLAVASVSLKGLAFLHRSIKIRYPHLPFVISDTKYYDHDLYSAATWVREHTRKDDLFLGVLGDGKNEAKCCDGALRNQLLRSMWCQDLVGAYGDLDAFREWRRRRAVLKEYLGQPFVAWDSLLDQERIDYVISARDSRWPEKYKLVYENRAYAIYKAR